MRATGIHQVLFLCPDNAVLGPMAEVLLNHWGRGRFQASSAGWRPAAAVHPLALRALRRSELGPLSVRTRDWRDLSGFQKTPFRVLVILGDEVPDEVDRDRGNTVLMHWQVSNPADVVGPPETLDRAFERALRALEARVRFFVRINLETMDARAGTGAQLQQSELGSPLGPRALRAHRSSTM